MINIRLKQTFRFDHIELSEGETIGVRDDLAHQLVRLGVAEYAEPQRAIITPEELRTAAPAQPAESRIVVPNMTGFGPPPRRGPGRPPRQQ